MEGLESSVVSPCTLGDKGCYWELVGGDVEYSVPGVSWEVGEGTEAGPVECLEGAEKMAGGSPIAIKAFGGPDRSTIKHDAPDQHIKEAEVGPHCGPSLGAYVVT